MSYFKTFSRPQQFFIIFFMLATFATLVSLRHFSVAVLWGIGVTLMAFTPPTKAFFKELWKVLKHPGFILLEIFLAWSFITSFWSLNPSQTFRASLSFGATLLLFAVLVTHLRSWSKDLFTFFMRTLPPLILLSSVVLFLQTLGLGTLKTLSGYSWSTLKPNVTLLLTLTIPVIAYLHLTYKKKFLPLILLGVLFFLSYKIDYLAGLLGIIIASVAAGLSYRYSRFIPMVLAYFSAFICLILPLFFHLIIPTLDISAIWNMPFLSSFAHRLYIWEFITTNIWEKPFLGWGATTSRGFPTQNLLVADAQNIFPSHPHNHIMQVWLEMGAVGAVILAALHFFAFRAIAKLESPLATAWALFFAIVNFVILSLSHSIWHKWWITWLGAMTILFIIIIQRHKKSAL